MLENQSIEKIIQNIQSSKLSIKELMEYYLDRIEKYNTNLIKPSYVLLYSKCNRRKKKIN